MVSNYGKIQNVNLKHNFVLPFVSALAVFLLTPLVFNITSLQEKEVARPFEFLLCWMGVMLLTPIFLPEQNKDIRDVVRSKKIDYLKVCVIRMLYSVVTLMVLEALFAGMMLWRESAVTVTHLFGGIATSLFFGMIGFAAAGISENTTIGYMAAMLYYLANYGLKERLGDFFLFSMSTGDFAGKGWMIVGAIVLCVITFLWIRIKN